MRLSEDVVGYCKGMVDESGCGMPGMDEEMDGAVQHHGVQGPEK